MLEENKTLTFIRSYLKAIEIDEFDITTTQDTMGYLILLDIPKTFSNKAKIPILLGRQGKNVLSLRRLVRVVGKLEGLEPLLIIRLK